MGSGREKRWVLLKIFFFIAVSTDAVLMARECCPPNTFLVERAKLCSDNISPYNLKCENGALLLDPLVNENDKFTVESSDRLSYMGGQRAPDEFCLGRIQGNGTERPEHEVALVCFDEDWSQPQISVVLQFLMLLSTLFLVLTLYIYAVLPNLKDLHGKCVIAFICCLIASYITLLVIQTFQNSSQEVCIVEAALLYFSMSATFFWNNIITFNIWRAVRNTSLKIKEKSCAVIYLIWGFGVPLTMVLLSFILEHLPDGNHVRPHFGEIKCWFKGKLESWVFFYGPVSVLLLLNTAMFLQSTWELWKASNALSISKIKSLKFKYMMYLKLFLLMGISWIFEVLSYATVDFENTKYLWIVTDCFNSAQGIIIFLILVVFRQKVRLGILKKKLFNINWPQSWTREELQESSTESIRDDVELANQKSTLVNLNKNSMF